MLPPDGAAARPREEQDYNKRAFSDEVDHGTSHITTTLAPTGAGREPQSSNPRTREDPRAHDTVAGESTDPGTPTGNPWGFA